jgi:phosphate:Na+ symporter
MQLEEVLFQALGGLGMFLLGMKFMSGGLQNVAGARLRRFLEVVSSNRVVGAAVGAMVTAAIQSSSVTTVTVVGFVNAGLINLTQAMGVILGANVGTTITAQIIAFKITALALPAIALGVGLKLFGKRRKWRYIGDVILGFGLLFFGMETMKAGFKPLRTDPEFIQFFTAFDAGTLGGAALCVVTGAALTMILQSSSATVGITMALASEGLLNLPGSVALILGENIGTTITAELASIGANLTARQAARAHTMFNVLGVALMLVLFGPFVELVTWVGQAMGTGPPDAWAGGERPNISRYIANAHTLFNVVNAVIWLFILPLLVKVAVRLTRGGRREEELAEDGRPQYLDRHFLDSPGVALPQARREIARMGRLAQLMFQEVTEGLHQRKAEDLGPWRQREEAINSLHREVTDYLVSVSQGTITEAESKEISALSRMVNNVERVGDSAENLAELVEEMHESGQRFSRAGLDDYTEIRTLSASFLELVAAGLEGSEPISLEKARELEDRIDQMREEMRNKHLTRLRQGVCTVDPGLILVDMLYQFEKVGDYCYNIAKALAQGR